MRGNSFGKMFSMTSFGESHGPAIGVVLDGVPAGLDFSLSDLHFELLRRAPGQVPGTTPRKEKDTPEILSGIFKDKTLGSPISIIIRNTNQRSHDYNELKDQYRPGHADKTTMHKYNIRDHRGGGRSSGRETIARVIAGYFASLVIPKVIVRAYATQLGKIKSEDLVPPENTTDFGPYNYIDSSKSEDIKKYLLSLKASGDSIGGRVAIIVDNCPVGLGEPAFDKLKADFSKALLSIGACVSFSYGLGEDIADLSGVSVSKESSSFGGIEGGISNGERIFMQVTFKPTSTVGDKAKGGRHDPCIIPRAIPVVEAMVKIVLADHFLRQNAYSNIIN